MKIIVAGAGHGGLAAAIGLAKGGHDVTVLEKKQRKDLGHDWEDRFTFSILLRITGKTELPENSWRYRGDCAFVSPDYKTRVVVNYTDENRQKIMWRKPLIEMLLCAAEENGVKLCFGTEVLAPVAASDRVIGVETKSGIVLADLVIDAAGAFSPVRMKLPKMFSIEKEPARGDVFFARRTYYKKTEPSVMPDVPFEVYLCHNREQGLSWCCTNEDSVDILIGRIDPMSEEKKESLTELFRKSHPYIGTEVLHGAADGVIPVRRPLSLMVANGYAAVGDSAFMTTPMNGMGIDLSLLAGELLAKTVNEKNSADVSALWEYNRGFHLLYGAETAKNEGLKNSLLELEGKGVDFLFESAVIQASDLAGAGRNTSVLALLGKFVRGMKKPKYFFAILGGIMKGSKVSSALRKAPEKYDREAVEKWQQSVLKNVVRVTRK